MVEETHERNPYDPTPEYIKQTLDFLKSIGINLPATTFYWTSFIDRHSDIPEVFTELPYKQEDSGKVAYHTPKHMLGVANIALRLSAEYRNMPTPTRAAVVIAAMYHDHSHTLGTSDDYTNIRIAVDEFTKSYSSSEHDVKIDYEHIYEWRNLVKDLIRSTLFVYGVERYPGTDASNVLRDADMLYMTVSKNTGEIFNELCSETIESNVGYTGLVEGYHKQVNFITKVKYFTPAAQLMFGRDLATSLLDIRNYISIKTNRGIDNV